MASAATDCGSLSKEPLMQADRRLFHAAAAALAATLAMPALAREARPALMLATDAPDDPDPRGWLVSEKLDGVRAFWDGQRLRFRNGGVIAAPAWFTAGLPQQTLDGELWAGRGRFDRLSGTVRRAVPVDSAWQQLHYCLFDLPGDTRPFVERAAALRRIAAALHLPFVDAVAQQVLTDGAALHDRLASVVAQGGEGLVLHRAAALWQPGRSADLRKLKPVADAEAVVIGHLPGQGRLAGRVGALRVRDEAGRTFQLGSGLGDAERALPPPQGSVVTYTYRGRTASGLPRFATYLRLRSVP